MTTATKSDTELIQDSLEGNQEAFGLLVQRYESQVAATVIGMLGNGEEAEDVGQEVFIRFFRSLSSYRGDAALGTYLTRIAINLSLNTLKKRKRKQMFRFFQSETKDRAFDIPDQGITQDQRDIQAMVQHALHKLAPEFRTVIVLRLLDGYSTKETAEILNLPLGTVLSRLARAQKKLKDILKQFE